MPLPEPGPDMVQLLTPAGVRVEHPTYSFEPDGDHAEAEFIRSLYRDLVLVRRLDVEATALQRHGELGIWAPLLGQEAAQIGAARAMRPRDQAFCTYREHGMAWVKGVEVAKLLSLFRGNDYGSWDPTTTHCGLYTIVIGAHALHGVGYAMALQKDGLVGTGDPERDTAVMINFGDGATSQGDVNEAFVFAATYDAPVVFFVQNNQWAISEPTQLQSRVPFYQRAEGFGFPGVRVDGNDVLATYAVTKAALQRAYEGGGPTLVEAFTYRMGAHTTTDDPTRYRNLAEVEAWSARDPLARVETYLRGNNLADEEFFTALAAEADELGESMRTVVKELPPPDPRQIFDWTFVEPTDELRQQADELDRYLASFEEAQS